MKKSKLYIQQLDSKISVFEPMLKLAQPQVGWIKAIRTTLGMSLQQLGNKLSITKQSVKEMEEREQQGAITIRSLKEAAKALDMKLVYGFVPEDGSLEGLINRRAYELAKEIVLRTSQTMKLEDQENSKERIEQAIRERAEEISRELPKMLWD